MTQQVITPTNLGLTIKPAHLAASKYDVQIDGATIKASPTGELSVDTSKLDITVVSADAGQVLVAGTDKGALLTKETFQDLVGDMVVDATDGLTYDDAIGALTAAVTSALGTDSDNIDMTVTLSGTGGLNIKATVILDPSTDNYITSSTAGLKVSKKTILDDVMDNLPATTNAHAVTTNSEFKTTVNGKAASTSIVEVTDAFGTYLGEMLLKS
jgi:hypothetical protein